MYRFIRKLFFLLPAERAHYVAMNLLKFVCDLPFGAAIIRKMFSPPQAKKVLAFGLEFPHIVGLGAGFDKNARYLESLQALGFGAVEVGTVTPVAQQGNSKPRLFRLPADKALVNRMGFNNDGAKQVAERLKKFRANKKNRLIIGGNIGKNKSTPNETAWQDYEKCFEVLHSFVDYFVVNVSSPNTPGLRELQEKESLRQILVNLQQINRKKQQPKPLLLKIAPDLTTEQVDDVVALALEIGLDGLVVSNTTLDRSNLSRRSTVEAETAGASGLSGAPLLQKNTDLVHHICKKLQGRMPVIASGGILYAAHAKEKLDAGATLVQVWTGFIYTGPGIIRQIVKNV